MTIEPSWIAAAGSIGMPALGVILFWAKNQLTAGQVQIAKSLTDGQNELAKKFEALGGRVQSHADQDDARYKEIQKVLKEISEIAAAERQMMVERLATLEGTVYGTEVLNKRQRRVTAIPLEGNA